MWPDDNVIIENPKGFTVIRDTREKANKGWVWNKNDRCNGMIEKALSVGDYTIKGAEDILRIERKATVSEIAGNLVESRFPKFLDKFTKYKYAFLVAECSFEDVMMFPVGSTVPKHMWNKVVMKGKVLRKKIVEAQLDYGLNIIWAGNSHNAWELVDSIFKRVYEDITKS